jgi:hypothetical protein
MNNNNMIVPIWNNRLVAMRWLKANAVPVTNGNVANFALLAEHLGHIPTKEDWNTNMH